MQALTDAVSAVKKTKHWRYAHIVALRADGVSASVLGMGGVVPEGTVRRALTAMEEEAGTNWLRLTKYFKCYIERRLQGDVLLANEHQPSLAICRSRRYMPKRSTHMQCSQRSARN